MKAIVVVVVLFTIFDNKKSTEIGIKRSSYLNELDEYLKRYVEKKFDFRRLDDLNASRSVHKMLLLLSLIFDTGGKIKV